MLRQCLVSALVICGVAAAQHSNQSATDVWDQHTALGRKLQAGGRYSEAKEQFQAALRVAGSFAQADGRNFSSQIALGVTAASMGQYTEAEQWDTEAIRLSMNIYGEDGAELAIPLTNLAVLYRD